MSKPTTENPLLILAMDHRDSFGKLFGIEWPPNDAEYERMRGAKLLIYRGLHAASIDEGQRGVLVDEELGADVLKAARADGLRLAMPVEKSGQKIFALQYGAETDRHLDEFAPDYVKVLVRMNPTDKPDDIATQLDGLRALSNDLHAAGRSFLYELLVPASDEQLAQVDGDKDAYDRDVRPGLVQQVIEANQDAGVEPTLWKIEGLETQEAAELVVAAAKRDGRTADCIVLGRDAPTERLDHWLSVAASVPGFVGWAIGRSIWEEPLQAHLKEPDEEKFISAVRDNYQHFAKAFLDAR